MDIAIFGSYNVPPLICSLAFGGSLPLVSLMFVRILANTAETETQANPELRKAKQTITKLRLDLEEVERRPITCGIIRAETASVATARCKRAPDVTIRLWGESVAEATEGRTRM